jgi:hypothetical protein
MSVLFVLYDQTKPLTASFFKDRINTYQADGFLDKEVETVVRDKPIVIRNFELFYKLMCLETNFHI